MVDGPGNVHIQPGQTVTGGGLPTGTTVVEFKARDHPEPDLLVLSHALTTSLTADMALLFNQHAETTVRLDHANANIVAGLSVEGPGVPPDAVVKSYGATGGGASGHEPFIVLTKAITKHLHSTTLTFNGRGVFLTLPAVNPHIKPGQPVTGPGLVSSTFVAGAFTGATCQTAVSASVCVKLTRAITTKLTGATVVFEPLTSTVHLASSASNAKIRVGQHIAVPGKTSIPTGTTVASVSPNGAVLGLSAVLTADLLPTDTLRFTTTVLELSSSAADSGVAPGQQISVVGSGALMLQPHTTVTKG